MATGLIGALRVTLGIDASQFQAGTSKAKAELRGFQREFSRTGKKLQNLGRDMTTYLTVPIAAVGAGVIKMAADFESAMIQAKIATGATAGEMVEMKQLAQDIGKATIFSASEAVSGMTMLAKAGVDTKTILGGAAKAVTDLAAAAGSELDPAASAISDTLKQFNQDTANLPHIVDAITGAVNESKMSFDDFSLAIGQSGGVAGSAGIEFDDFVTALAGTSSMFNSGSDAGTSFKQFMMTLTPTTKKAAEAMKNAGLQFYDADGKMKSLRDIAEQLQTKFGDMAEEDRNAQFKAMFGTDAIRTAIGLMKLGGEGFDQMQQKIMATDASAQAEQRMHGFNAEMEKLRGAFENLAIAIGDSGMLPAITNLVNSLGGLIDTMSKLSPETLKWTAIVATIAAALGPVILVIGGMVKGVGLLLPLLVRLGPVFQVITAALSYLVPAILAVSRALLVGLLGNPLLLGAAALLTGIYLAWKNWDKIWPIVQQLYVQVKTWIMDKLGPIWDWLKGKIDAVKGWFFGLYDAVVGHSYIPDMVDGIAQHMARLQSEMVDPVKKATGDAKQAFADLKQSVLSVLERLFPEDARYNQYASDLKLIEDNMRKLGFTAEQVAAAVGKLNEEFRRDAFGDEEPGWWEKLPDAGNDNEPVGPIAPDMDGVFEKMKKENDDALAYIFKETDDKTAKMIMLWTNLADEAVGALRGMVDSFKSGDILGGIEQMVDLIGSVLRQLSQAGIIHPGWGGGGSGGGSPGYSTGGSFMVGGSGGVDSQLVQFRATPGEQVRVDRRGDQGRRDPIQLIVRKGEMFDVEVARVARPMAEDAVQRGAVGGASIAAQNEFKRKRGALA